MRFFRKILAGILIVCLLSIQMPLAGAEDGELEPQIKAKAAILIEASTGRVIWEKNADERHYPASMTKIMTGILGLENIGPHTEIFISPTASATEDCPLGIKAGQRLAADELLTGMLMVSDNGAAVAVAEHIDGNVAAFATRMNRKAHELGMKDTNFVNPNGLTNGNHYSTPRDMAKLARYAMENPKFREIVGQKNGYIRWAFPSGHALPVENTNLLLGKYEGMTGIKTGWTQASGGCLAASAKRNGVELIAIIMQAPTLDDRFTDAKAILDYGFDHVKMVKGLSKDRVNRRVWVKGAKQATADVYLASDINYPLLNGEDASHYTVTYDLPKVIEAPHKDGDVIGKAIIKYDGEQIGTVDMTVGKVEKGFSIGSWLVKLFEPLLVRS